MNRCIQKPDSIKFLIYFQISFVVTIHQAIQILKNATHSKIISNYNLLGFFYDSRGNFSMLTSEKLYEDALNKP
jgi:hypothetical protein